MTPDTRDLSLASHRQTQFSPQEFDLSPEFPQQYQCFYFISLPPIPCIHSLRPCIITTQDFLKTNYFNSVSTAQPASFAMTSVSTSSGSWLALCFEICLQNNERKGEDRRGGPLLPPVITYWVLPIKSQYPLIIVFYLISSTAWCNLIPLKIIRYKILKNCEVLDYVQTICNKIPTQSKEICYEALHICGQTESSLFCKKNIISGRYGWCCDTIAHSCDVYTNIMLLHESCEHLEICSFRNKFSLEFALHIRLILAIVTCLICVKLRGPSFKLSQGGFMTFYINEKGQGKRWISALTIFSCLSGDSFLKTLFTEQQPNNLCNAPQTWVRYRHFKMAGNWEVKLNVKVKIIHSLSFLYIFCVY